MNANRMRSSLCFVFIKVNDSFKVLYKLYVFIKTENISIWISKIKIEGEMYVKLGDFFTFKHVFSGFAEKDLIILYLCHKSLKPGFRYELTIWICECVEKILNDYLLFKNRYYMVVFTIYKLKNILRIIKWINILLWANDNYWAMGIYFSINAFSIVYIHC